jgi:hypothetical protein
VRLDNVPDIDRAPRAHLADRVPVLTEPFRTGFAHVILTGEKP